MFIATLKGNCESVWIQVRGPRGVLHLNGVNPPPCLLTNVRAYLHAFAALRGKRGAAVGTSLKRPGEKRISLFNSLHNLCILRPKPGDEANGPFRYRSAWWPRPPAVAYLFLVRRPREAG